MGDREQVESSIRLANGRLNWRFMQLKKVMLRGLREHLTI
jgi:hypothetical protein